MFRTASFSRVVLLSAIALVLLPRVGLAQAPATTLEELARHLASGATIAITDHAGQTVKGKLVQLTPAQLVLLTDGRQVTFTSETLSEVRQRQRDSLKNGMLIGGAIGAVPLIIVGSSNWCSDEPDCDATIGLGLLYIAAGVGAGAGLDALTSRQTVLYRRAGATLDLQPAFGRGRVGLSVSIRF
jgi:hypothetical protein